MSSALAAAPSSLSPLPVVPTVPRVIPVDLIDENPLNPRKRFAGLGELGKNMMTLGQLVEARVRPHPTAEGRYQLVAGARRRRACLEVGKPTLNCLLGDFSDAHVMAIALSDSTQDALTDWEQAEGFAAAIKMPGATKESVAAATGFSRDHISARLCLLRAPAKTREMLQEGLIGSNLAHIIARVPGDAVRLRVEEAILPARDGSGALSVRAARELVKEKFSRTLTGAAFDTEDAALVAEAGACRACPHRAGSNPAVYGDVDNPNTCMQPACFLAKEAAARERKVAERQARAAEGEAERVALSAGENARAFPVGAREPSPESGYIAYTRPMPADLLKPEVAEQGAPRVCDVVEGVRVHVGTDDAGREVEVVKLAEAVLGVTEPAILKREVAQKYGAVVVAGPVVKGAPAAGSLAADAAAEKRARQAAERATGKRKRAAAEFLCALYGALRQMAPAQGEYALWSLLYEHHLETTEDEDCAVLVRAVAGDIPAKGEGKAALKTFAAELRGAAELRALVVCMVWGPSLVVADAGVQEPWVVEIHKVIVAPTLGSAGVAGGAGAEAGGAASPRPRTLPLAEGESERLNEIARAHGGGMSAHKIAREFGAPLADVCGMLQLDAAAEEEAREDLYDKVLELWGERGIVLAARPAAIRQALGREVAEADLAPEELRRILENTEARNAPPLAK